MNFKLKNQEYKGRPINPTNHVKRVIRQGLFLYILYRLFYNINFSVFLHNLLNDKKIRILDKTKDNRIYGV